MYELLETQIQPEKLGIKNLGAKHFNKIWRTKLIYKIYEHARTNFWNKIWGKKLNTKFEAQELEKAKVSGNKKKTLFLIENT